MPKSTWTQFSARRSAILLDALGTLLALEPPAPLLKAELQARLGIAVTLQQAGDAIAAEIAFYRAHLDEGRDQASLALLRTRCGSVIRDVLAPAASLDLDAATEVLLASLRFACFDDVRPALEQARRSGYRLVVVSNWDVSLHDILERLGLDLLLDGVVTSAEVGERKPARAIFERALKLAGVSASSAVHVGDSVEEDVKGARAAGIEPVLVRRDGSPSPPGVRTIASLAELLT